MTRVSLLGLNYTPESTGIAPYTTGLAEGLRANGHDVNTLVGNPHYPEWKLADGYTGRRSTETINGVPVTRLRHFIPDPPSAKGRVRMEASFGAQLVGADWADPEVIVCVSPALLSTAMAVARTKATRKGKRPAVGIWVQDLYSLGVVETGAMSGRSARAAARFESAVLRAADGVAVIHDRFRDHVVGALGVEHDRVRVIRNWTHLEPITLPDRDRSRAELGWGPDEVIVLHAGNMGAKQGLENVVEAAKLADKNSAPVRFVLLGDGNQRAHLEELGQDVEHLTFLKPLPDKEFQTALAAADLLLVNEKPSVAEMAVPSKLTSYFSTGNPVLAATAPDSVTGQEVESSGGGKVVPAGDPQRLLDGALELASDRALCRRLGAAGRAFCEQKLSMNFAIDQYSQWITDLAQAGVATRQGATTP